MCFWAGWLGLVRVDKKYKINIFLAEVEKKYSIQIFLACLNVLVVVLHGQNCVVNENCLYKAILKRHFTTCVPILLSSSSIKYDFNEFAKLGAPYPCNTLIWP